MKNFKHLIILLGVLFLNNINVDASVSLGSNTLTSNNFVVKGTGNQTLKFSDDIVYGQYGTGDYPPSYYLVTFCTDSQNITSWYDNDGYLPTINFYNTNYKCMFPNSTYNGGHIVYLYGQINPKWSTSATSATLEGNLTYYQPNQASWALLSIQTSSEEISIDYASGSIISQNQTIIDQNLYIIEQNNNTYDMQQKEHNETQEKLEEVNETNKGIWNTIKNLPKAFLDMLLGLFIPDNMDFLNDFVDVLEDKLGFIASIPIQLIEFITNLVSTSWETFDSITLPSINIFGYNFWNAQEIDLTEAINIFKPFKYVTDVICVVICARTLNRWRETFSGGGSGE